jgi:hypothetical protein
MAKFVIGNLGSLAKQIRLLIEGMISIWFLPKTLRELREDLEKDTHYKNVFSAERPAAINLESWNEPYPQTSHEIENESRGFDEVDIRFFAAGIEAPELSMPAQRTNPKAAAVPILLFALAAVLKSEEGPQSPSAGQDDQSEARLAQSDGADEKGTNEARPQNRARAKNGRKPVTRKVRKL